MNNNNRSGGNKAGGSYASGNIISQKTATSTTKKQGYQIANTEKHVHMTRNTIKTSTTANESITKKKKSPSLYGNSSSIPQGRKSLYIAQKSSNNTLHLQ